LGGFLLSFLLLSLFLLPLPIFLTLPFRLVTSPLLTFIIPEELFIQLLLIAFTPVVFFPFLFSLLLPFISYIIKKLASLYVF
jgi:hypothetical protein